MINENFFQADQITPADRDLEILDFSVEPYPDHRRVKVIFRLSYFQTPPNAALTLQNEEGEELASVEVINIIETENEFTLHIPASHAELGKYQVKLTLFSLIEQEAGPGEKGEVSLITQNLNSKTVSFSLQ